MGLYGIGQPVRREEDPRLITGRGRYADDVRPAGMTHGYVLRSAEAHARIRSLNIEAARSAPGVHAVLTAVELKARGLGAQKPSIPKRKRDGSPPYITPQPLLAGDRVRFVGQPIAFVVADTLAHAKDAAELIEIDYESLPAVVNVDQATAEGAPAVWDDNPGNEAYFHEVGDVAAVEAAFANADHVIRHRVVISRVAANPMEPRGCIAEYDPVDDIYTLRATIQSTHNIRTALAGPYFKKNQTHFRVVCDNMGGGFGMKGGCYPEYVLSTWAAEAIGRPVKWISERSEGLLSDEQARDSVVEAELALDKAGRFLALRTLQKSGIGAYNTTDRNVAPTITAINCLTNTYKTPAIHARVMGIFINTMTIAHYRGGGRPEPLYIIERMVDLAARKLGMSPFEIRKLNCLWPEDMPYDTPLGQNYDDGNFPKNMDDCARIADLAGADRRREEARGRGRVLGIGIANVCEPSGNGVEYAELRFDPSGSVTILAGAMDHGQGHGTTFKQVVSEKLGIDADLIRYRYGDTDAIAMGVGTFGSRTTALCGGAISLAAEKIVEKGKKVAAHMLEASVGDIEFANGNFTVAGTDRSLSIVDVARRSFVQGALPRDMEPGLYDQASYSAYGSWPNGTHIVELEIDPETGAIELKRYSAVDDIGVILNPLLAEGQIIGGIVQGTGQALMENVVYDPASGQLITGSFMDYCMPRADAFCDFTLHENVVPTTRNALGVKGAGETGTCGSIPAVMNAVNDALHSVGVDPIEMPATPQKVWAALRQARQPVAA